MVNITVSFYAPSPGSVCTVTPEGDVLPCAALRGYQVEEGHGLLGIVRQRVTDLKRDWAQYVFKARSPESGLVLRHCPFCGVRIGDAREDRNHE